MTLLTQIAQATRLTANPKPHIKHFGWCSQADVVTGELLELENRINEGLVIRMDANREPCLTLTPAGVSLYFLEQQ